MWRRGRLLPRGVKIQRQFMYCESEQLGTQRSGVCVHPCCVVVFSSSRPPILLHGVLILIAAEARPHFSAAQLKLEKLEKSQILISVFLRGPVNHVCLSLPPPRLPRSALHHIHLSPLFHLSSVFLVFIFF